MKPRSQRLLAGIAVAFAIGAACRVTELPVPAPHVLEGAALILALTLGYATADRVLSKTDDTNAASSHSKPGDRPS